MTENTPDDTTPLLTDDRPLDTESFTPTGTCIACRETVPVDGKQAETFASQVVCHDCMDVAVVFLAECLDCDWDYRCEERVTNRYHARVRVQQEGNAHESKMNFRDESHETVWREIVRPEEGQNGG